MYAYFYVYVRKMECFCNKVEMKTNKEDLKKKKSSVCPRKEYSPSLFVLLLLSKLKVKENHNFRLSPEKK